MSADNGIYILETRDGFRVTHAQAIDNLYWHPNCCDNPDVHDTNLGEDLYYHEKCENCGAIDPEFIPQDQVYLPTVYHYFKASKVYPDRESAMKRADEIESEILSDDFCGIIEYGIQFINGLEDFDFPAMEVK